MCSGRRCLSSELAQTLDFRLSPVTHVSREQQPHEALGQRLASLLRRWQLFLCVRRGSAGSNMVASHCIGECTHQFSPAGSPSRLIPSAVVGMQGAKTVKPGARVLEDREYRPGALGCYSHGSGCPPLGPAAMFPTAAPGAFQHQTAASSACGKQNSAPCRSLTQPDASGAACHSDQSTVRAHHLRKTKDTCLFA